MDPLSLTGEPTLSPTQSTSTIAISPTERPTKEPTLFQTEQPTIEPTSAASQTQINDFSSKAAMQSAGWSWNLHNLWDFIKDNSAFCNGAPTSAYCGFAHPGDLTLSYTFKKAGRIQIEWGQSWASGQVVIRANGVEIDSMNSIGRKTSEFGVSTGDVLEVAEVNLSIMVMYDIVFTPDGSVPSTTAIPTMTPTLSPTQEPSLSWTEQPTMMPSLSPTEEPTKERTLFLTKKPTTEPTSAPSQTQSASTTAISTMDPTLSLTQQPSLSPTERPTKGPTLFPTEQHTIEQTSAPSQTLSTNYVSLVVILTGVSESNKDDICSVLAKALG